MLSDAKGQFLSVALIFFYIFSGNILSMIPGRHHVNFVIPSLDLWFSLHVSSSLIRYKETKRYTKREIGHVRNQSAIKRCLGHANAHFLSHRLLRLVGNREGMRLDREAKQRKEKIRKLDLREPKLIWSFFFLCDRHYFQHV